MSSICLWVGWTFPLWSLWNMKCFLFTVFRPISIHSLPFLLNMSPLILKDVCVHVGLTRQNMYKHMQTCKHTQHTCRLLCTHMHICTFESFDKADCAVYWREILWRENMKTFVVLGAKVCLEPSFDFAPWGPRSSSQFWSSYQIRFLICCFPLAPDWLSAPLNPVPLYCAYCGGVYGCVVSVFVLECPLARVFVHACLPNTFIRLIYMSVRFCSCLCVHKCVRAHAYVLSTWVCAEIFPCVDF